MGKYISCGKFNNYNYYIILIFIFDLLNDSLYGFNYIDLFDDLKLINTKTQLYFSWHHIIHQMFNYFGTLIFAFCFYRYEKHSSKSEAERKSPNTSNQDNINNIQLILIHNNLDDDLGQQDINFYICLLIILIWVIEEQLFDIYNYALKDLDFWMVEILIITYLNSYMFKTEIYKHQKFAIWINMISGLFKASTIILSLFDDNKEEMPVLYNVNKLLIPIGIIIFIILIIIRSYINIKIKCFMDLKYISHNQLLIFYGLIGTIACALTTVISTFIKCNNNLKEIEISDYICKIPYQGTDKKFNTSGKYLENFFLYFKTFKGEINKDFKKIEILYEIIIIIAGIITFFFVRYFSVLVIKHLTPVHLIFSIPIFYFFQKMFLVIYNYAKKQFFNHSKIKYIKEKFVLDITSDFFSFFGFLIYLEMIELKCRQFDYNIKKNITRRSFGESYGIHEGKKKNSTVNNRNEPILENEEGEEEEEEEDESNFTLNE